MKILDRLPIDEAGWIVPTPDGADEVKPYQIVVQVSIAPDGVGALPDGALRFPAILDTGNNHNFAIRREQLDRWAPLTLRPVGRVLLGTSPIPLFAADVWIYPNRPETTDPGDDPPFRLELQHGIVVYPPGVPNPARLPILGLRGLIRNRLRLTIDGDSRNVNLESPSA